MNWWNRIVGQLGLSRQPSNLEILEAHLEALFERYAPARASSSIESLAVEPAAGVYRVVVEAGLSRIEVEAATPRMACILIPLDAFLTHVQGAVGDPSAVQQLLHDEGLARRPGSGVLELVASTDGARAYRRIGERIESLLMSLFDHPVGTFYSVAIEREVNPENEELLEHIRVLARKNDMESRRLVYQSVVNARFWLPLQEADNEHLLPSVEHWPEPFDDKPVWAVFTDAEALREHRSRVQPAVVVTGVRLVQALHAHGVGALKINPRSKVGGELYGSEIETLANYLRSMGLLTQPSAVH